MASQFALAFRSHVIPTLRRRCATNAALMRHHLMGWNAAFDDALRLACDRGALNLDDTTFRELEDWLASELLREVDAPEPPVDCERVAAGSRNPEAMRWTLAAIYPEYRKQLVTSRGR